MGGGGTGFDSSWLGGISTGSSGGSGFGGFSLGGGDYLYDANGNPVHQGVEGPMTENGPERSSLPTAEEWRKRQELMDMLQGLGDAFGKQQQGARPQQAQLPGIGSASGPGPAAPPKMNDVRYTLPLIAQLMGWGAEADPRNPVILQIANRRK